MRKQLLFNTVDWPKNEIFKAYDKLFSKEVHYFNKNYECYYRNHMYFPDGGCEQCLNRVKLSEITGTRKIAGADVFNFFSNDYIHDLFIKIHLHLNSTWTNENNEELLISAIKSVLEKYFKDWNIGSVVQPTYLHNYLSYWLDKLETNQIRLVWCQKTYQETIKKIFNLVSTIFKLKEHYGYPKNTEEVISSFSKNFLKALEIEELRQNLYISKFIDIIKMFFKIQPHKTFTKKVKKLKKLLKLSCFVSW